MKIALPTKDMHIDDHFGHCDHFTIVTLDPTGKKVVSKDRLDSPTGCGCKSNIASILKDLGVKTMLAGNMGDGAVKVLNHAGIEVIRGCKGSVDLVTTDYLNGRVKDSNESCTVHECHQ